jgi:hypothetical protein
VAVAEKPELLLSAPVTATFYGAGYMHDLAHPYVKSTFVTGDPFAAADEDWHANVTNSHTVALQGILGGFTGSIASQGADPTVPRPAVSGTVIWVGSVQPNNATSQDIWINTSGIAPVVSTTVLGALNVGIYTDQLMVFTGTAPVVWSITQGPLPPGTQFSSGGEFYGTPTGPPGPYSFTALAVNGYGDVAVPFSGTVGPAVAPVVTTGTLGPGITTGVSFALTLSATGSMPMTWSSTALPGGLSLNTNTGVIAGTPLSSAAGPYSFTVTANNIAGTSPTQTVSGSINGQPPTITDATLRSMTQGVSFSQLPAHSGTTPITWSNNGAMPSWMTQDSDGTLHGIPSSTAGYNFTVTATNSYGTATQPYSGSVASASPVVTSTTLDPTWTLVAIGPTQTGVTLAATGATPFTWAATGLPSWATLNTTTGVITGTPTGTSYSFTVTATNSYGTSPAKTISGTINSSTPVIGQTSLTPAPVLSKAFSQQLTATGYQAGSMIWTTTSGAWPAGITMSTGGLVSSTNVTGTGTGSATVTATNSVTSSTQVISWSVVDTVISVDQFVYATNAGSTALAPTITINPSVCAYAFVTKSMSGSIPPSTITIGGTSMSSMMLSGTPVSIGAYFAWFTSVYEVFVLNNPPTGSAQPVVCTHGCPNGASMAVVTVNKSLPATSFASNVNSTGGGTATVSQIVNSATGHFILQAMINDTATGMANYTPPTAVVGVNTNIAVGGESGASSRTFTVDITYPGSTHFGYATIGLDLSPSS